MSTQINKYFHDDGKSKNELIENYEICKTTYSDVTEIVNILSTSFNITSKREVVRQLLYSDADLDNSVKLIDKRDGKIYGLLILSKFPINVGSPLSNTNPMLNDYLTNFKQLNGHSFIIDSRLRGCGVDKRMLLFQKDYICEYDFVWCGVENNLKTHEYWKHLGFIELFETNEAKFYIYPNDRKMLFDIFILKMLSKNG